MEENTFVEPEPVRKMAIDEASMSVPALNNFVVSLIKPLRNARVRVIRHLTNKLKKVRTSKKKSDMIEKKANNMLEEIKEIKVMKLDNELIKKLLAKQVNEKDLSKASSPGERALIRLALQKSQFTDLVSKFRKEHADWVSLTDFMLSKHGGRRFRKKNAKISSEKLAKTTLDVADKRARDQYVSGDQRHQHNKRPVALKPVAAASVVETCEIEPDNRTEDVTLEKEPQVPSTWLSSIFSIPKENETSTLVEDVPDKPDVERSPKVHKSKESDEGVVVRLDPEMLSKPSIEGATLTLPVDGLDRKHQTSNSKESFPNPPAQDSGDQDVDFFVPLDEGGNDEISRPGEKVLTFHDIADFEESDGNSYRRGSRGRGGRGMNRGSNNRGFPPFRQQKFHQNNINSRNVQGAAPPKVEEKLHASWEARRQERNKQKLTIASAAQADPKKHIKFNDDV